jgi:hypothetical protein
MPQIIASDFYYIQGSYDDFLNKIFHKNEIKNKIVYVKVGTNLLHNENGPALIDIDHKIWAIEGKYHRLDGPAIEYNNGYKAWFVNGNLHRLNGPAIELIDSNKGWFINGFRVGCEKEKILDAWYEINNGSQKNL